MSKSLQTTFEVRNSLVFNCLCGAYFSAIVATGISLAPERTRYYQESREGVYGGSLFLLTNWLQSLPVSLTTTLIAAMITFRGLHADDVDEYAYFPDLVTVWLTLWACYSFAEQHTLSILLFVKSSYSAISASVAIAIVYLLLGSATLKAYNGMPSALAHLTYATQTRYAGAVLHRAEFFNRSSLVELPWLNDNGVEIACSRSQFGFGCRYINGTHFLAEKYGFASGAKLDDFFDVWFNVGVSVVFAVGLFFVNLLLYVIPLPAFVKAKFRELNYA